MASTLSLVTLILAWRGVMSVEVGTLSNASINKAIGENATVVWNVTGIEASDRNPLNLQLGKGELKRENFIFEFTVYAADSISLAKVSDSSVHRELASRSTAIYTYTGKSSGKESARVSFTINNLTLADEGSYVLSAKEKFLTTNISVNYGPEKCGFGLKPEYIAIPGDPLMITSGFCGEPQPMVTCTINGSPLNNVVIGEVSQYKYTYTVTIPKLEPCDTKEFRCTATAYGKPFSISTIVRGEFTSNVASVLRNIVFIRECDNCSTVSWRKEDTAGKCDVHHQLQFFNGTNSTTTIAYLKGNSYSNCSLQFENVRVVTSVYGTLNGTYKLLDKCTSNIVQLFYKSCATTTTTTTTTATTDVDTLCSKLNEKAEEVESKSVINIILSVIIVLFVILVLLFIVLVKTGRLKIEFIQQSKPKNFDQKYQENIQDVNTVMEPPSDYMELQAARKDTTYQALTSVQSTPDAAKDNSAYEVYYKKH